ncbi:MAG: NAD(P)-dependent oxidoreductase [Candidatus Omnitrophica bacterium]|nr:NAD(P)-dependent oxidoreductase [Candidatus Omnitrophota bacterium]
MADKVVVFGGAGFLGSHVADRLSDKGYEVYIFDIKPSCYIRPNQKMIVADIMDLYAVESAVKGARFVYAFSGIAGIKDASDEPLRTVRLNILGTAHILDAACRMNVERVVFASSLYVYSDLGSFYRSSKQACELLIEDYHKMYDLDYTILRFGSLYGDRANEFNYLRQAILQAFTEARISRKGDGEEIREYVHVRDAASASVEILDDRHLNRHVMITGAQAIKVKDMLAMIQEMMGNKIQIEYTSDRLEEHYKTTPFSFSPRVAEKYFGQSHLDLNTGLLDLIQRTYEELRVHNKLLAVDLEHLQSQH